MCASVYRITELPDGRWRHKREAAKKPTAHTDPFSRRRGAVLQQPLVDKRPNCEVLVEKRRHSAVVRGISR